MTHQELAPFVGRAVSIDHVNGHVITGMFERLPSQGEDAAYFLRSVDGDLPPVTLKAADIAGISA